MHAWFIFQIHKSHKAVSQLREERGEVPNKQTKKTRRVKPLHMEGMLGRYIGEEHYSIKKWFYLPQVN